MRKPFPAFGATSGDESGVFSATGTAEAFAVLAAGIIPHLLPADGKLFAAIGNAALEMEVGCAAEDAAAGKGASERQQQDRAACCAQGDFLVTRRQVF